MTMAKSVVQIWLHRLRKCEDNMNHETKCSPAEPRLISAELTLPSLDSRFEKDHWHAFHVVKSYPGDKVIHLVMILTCGTCDGFRGNVLRWPWVAVSMGYH